jgi:fumarate hydratase class II
MRIEKDTMGEMQVPDQALYGASTQRAVLNFQVSGLLFPRHFIRALGIIKKASAKTNLALKLIDEKRANAIIAACDEVIEGKLDSHFVVDIFQTGSGTSTNMNCNEVVANRAIALLGGKFGDRSLVHPNDHVNFCQSSNDVIPSAMHIAACLRASEVLLPALEELAGALRAKEGEFKEVIKAGRTHLQDATPVSLGQEFGGYAAQVEYGIERVNSSLPRMLELALGGTAVGTGLNAHPEFARGAITEIAKETKLKFCEARNHFEAQSGRDAALELSGQLKTVAISLLKIANDLRWLSSGPRCNLFEIQLPEIQPGSSIMPAKVNPVICESIMMVSALIIGNDGSITVCAQHGNFELNVMMPIMAYALLQSIEVLGNASRNFKELCIKGIQANRERCAEFAEKSLATCTSLAPKIGYDNAAKVAKQAFLQDKTVRQVAKELKLLDEAELNRLLDLEAMTKPGL